MGPPPDSLPSPSLLSSSLPAARRPRPSVGSRAGTGQERPTRAPLAELLVSLLPFSAVLVAYAAAQWINAGLNADPVAGHRNGFGFPLHVTEPIAADRWMFGELPTGWLQRQLYPDGAAHWWDALVAVVYSSHFVVIPVIGAVLWFRHRERFRPWVWSVLLLTAAGVVLYVVYPMAPPWMAARDGYLEPVQRLSGVGWRVLGLDALDSLQSQGQQQGNTVAAMPSLHAGAATVVAAFFWAGRGVLGRLLLSTYPLAMAFVLVLTGEHYLLDILVGTALAVLAVLVVSAVVRRQARQAVRTAEPAGPAQPAGLAEQAERAEQAQPAPPGAQPAEPGQPGAQPAEPGQPGAHPVRPSA